MIKCCRPEWKFVRWYGGCWGGCIIAENPVTRYISSPNSVAVPGNNSECNINIRIIICEARLKADVVLKTAFHIGAVDVTIHLEIWGISECCYLACRLTGITTVYVIKFL